MLRFDEIKTKTLDFLKEAYHLGMREYLSFFYLESASPVVSAEGFFHAIWEYLNTPIGDQAQFQSTGIKRIQEITQNIRIPMILVPV